MLAGIDIHIQRLGKTNTVELAANLTPFLQPVSKLFTNKRNMNHFQVVQLKRLLEEQRQRGLLNFSGQFIMRFTAEHTAKTVYF